MSDADGNNDMNKEVEGKKIVIQGTNNRYQVKKLIQAKTDTKRKAVEHWKFNVLLAARYGLVLI